MTSKIRIAFFLMAAILLAVPADAEDLSSMSIVELMELDVTSVSKKEQKLSEAPAAVFVITSEDIRRSGATSIPEALRLAPGLQVARIGAYRWAITSRGFNDAFANNLLVLIDGRSVYTPIFAGVFWDTQDVFMEDIERIEVIRGPGASLWGANAVNGVINVITKNSYDTPGTLFSGGGGSEERGFAGVRHGGDIGEETSYRTYLKWFERDDFKTDLEDQPGSDERGRWWALRSGFRADSDIGPKDLLTLQGDVQHTVTSQELVLEPKGFELFPDAPRRAEKNGVNLLGRFTREHSETSSSQLQSSYHFIQREDGSFRHRRHTFDLDFQHRVQLSDRHDVIAGAAYRYYTDDTNGDILLSFDPEDRDSNLYSGFVQDEIEIIEDTVALIVGSKIEHNAHTGVEVQPNLRTIWTPTPRQTWWASVSKAVRTPSRLEDDISVILATLSESEEVAPTFARLSGTRDVESVDLYAIELGHRAQVLESLSYDVAAFYNIYRDLYSAESGTPFIDTTTDSSFIVVPTEYDNLLKAESHGVELFVDWRVIDWWRLMLTYTFFDASVYGSSSSDFLVLRNYERNSSEHLGMIRSQFDLPHDLEFDAALRAVDNNRSVAGYVELDARLGWNFDDNIELSLVGQNLLSSSHREWDDNRFGQPSVQAGRGVYAKVVWKLN